MQSSYLPLAMIAYMVLTLVVPVLRTRIRHGIWPTVFLRTSDPMQRLMGGALGLIFAAAGLWAALLAVLGPGPLGVWQTPGWAGPAGWAMVAAGAALELWAQRTMGPSFRVGIDDVPTALVTGGPFRLVRNPIFSGLLLSVAGFVLLAPGTWTVAGYLVAAGLIVAQVRLEERYMIRSHGTAYLAYAARVGRFVPGLGRLESAR